MKYINAEKLKDEIKKRISLFQKEKKAEEASQIDVVSLGARSAALEEILVFIDSLQQEQSEVDDIKREWYNKGYIKGRQEAHIPARELGLPKAFDFKPLDEDLERDAVSFCYDNGLNTTPHIAKTIAKHFYELGLNAEK